MTATPAQVANDLDAQANHFSRADVALAQTCRDAARAIRVMQDEGTIDGRTFGGLHARMLNMVSRYGNTSDSQIAKSLRRGLLTLQDMHSQLVKGALK